MVYSIGEMAKQLNIAPSTLRYYDKEGLLPFVERSKGGRRIFQETDYEFLQIIGCLKATGMQLKDIRKFIYMVLQGDASIESRLQLFQKRKEEVEKQMSELQATLDTIAFKCWYYETAMETGTTEIVDNMSVEELPKEFRHIRARLRKEDIK